MHKIYTLASAFLFQALACFPATSERQLLSKEHEEYDKLIRLIRIMIGNNPGTVKEFDTTKDPKIYDTGRCYIAIFEYKKDDRIRLDLPAFYVVKKTGEISLRETSFGYFDCDVD